MFCLTSEFVIIIIVSSCIVNPLIASLKLQSNGPSYSNTVIGTLAIDGRAVTFGTARRELGVVKVRRITTCQMLLR